MGFTQPCFIRKNTPELRKKLEELGYKYSTVGGIKSNNIVVSLGCIFDIYPVDTIKRGFNNCIDCETNEELFLALAALRDDSDYMQLEGHKATVKELIKHFKDEWCTKNTIK